MQAILMAGGSGQRLRPITQAVSKHLLPIYNKPMIFYSLSLIMLAGIRDIILVVDPKHEASFVDLLGDGQSLGIKLKFVTQAEPLGIAEGLLLSKKYLKSDRFMFILGDNLCFGSGLKERLRNACYCNKFATLFSYQVSNPKDFGVLEFDENKKLINIIEKPRNPNSNYICTGIFVFDTLAVKFAEKLSKSERGEYEIADVIAQYIKKDSLDVELLGGSISWMDCGTFESLRKASNLVQLVESTQGFAVADLEAIASNNNWIK